MTVAMSASRGLARREARPKVVVTTWVGSRYWPLALALMTVLVAVYAAYAARASGNFGVFGDEAAHMLHARRVWDSATPGLGQLGQYWPPLYQILQVPFAWNDFLYRTGLSGTIPALLCFFAAVAGSYQLGLQLTGDRRAGAVAGIALAANANLLYLSTAAMMESSIAMALVWAAAMMARFWRTATFTSAAGAGLAAGLAAWAHYGAWGMPVYGAALVVVVGRRRGWTWRKVETCAAVFLLAAVHPIVTWLGWCWFLQDDPLYFVHFGLAGNGQGLEPAPLQGQPGNPVFAIANYGMGAWDVFGPVATSMAATVLLVALVRRKFLHPVGLTLAAAGFVVTAFTVAGGAIGSSTFAALTHSDLPSVADDSNIRYALFLSPFVAGCAALLAGKARWRQALVGMALLSGTTWFVPSVHGIDATVNQAEFRQAALDQVIAEKLADSLGPGRVLLSSAGGGDTIVWRSGLDASRFITQFNGRLFLDTMRDPAGHVSWVLVTPGSTEVFARLGPRLNQQDFRAVWTVDGLSRDKPYVLFHRGSSS